MEVSLIHGRRPRQAGVNGELWNHMARVQGLALFLPPLHSCTQYLPSVPPLPHPQKTDSNSSTDASARLRNSGESMEGSAWQVPGPLMTTR